MLGRTAVVLSHLALAVVAAGTSGCTTAADLKGPDKSLPGDEASALRRKADAGLAEARYVDAWNLEAQAGNDRARLEAIALAALEADKGPYDDMLKALREKFSGLSGEARARVDALSKAHEAKGEWKDAAHMQIVAADDAPKYAAAWSVYDRTPVKYALDVYQSIEKARTTFEEEKAEDAKRRSGK